MRNNPQNFPQKKLCVGRRGDNFSFYTTVPYFNDNRIFCQKLGSQTPLPRISALKFRCFNFPQFFSKFGLENLAPPDKNDIQGDALTLTHIYLPEPVLICPERSTLKTKIVSSCINSEIEILIFIPLSIGCLFYSFFLRAFAVLCASFLRFGGNFFIFQSENRWGWCNNKGRNNTWKVVTPWKSGGRRKKKTQRELNGAVYPMIIFLFTRPLAAYANLGGGGGMGARQCSVLRNLSTPWFLFLLSSPHTAFLVGNFADCCAPKLGILPVKTCDKLLPPGRV